MSRGQSRTGTRREQDPTRLVPWLQERNRTFSHMSADVLRELFGHAEVRRYSRGAVVQTQDEPATHAYVVTEGTITVRVKRTGITRELFSYEPGDVAGLLAFVDQQVTPYEIFSSTNTEVIRIDTRRIARLRAAFHPLAMSVLDAFMPMLVEHLRELDKRCVKLAARKNASIHGSGQKFRRDDR